MSVAEYESLVETLAILADPGATADLRESAEAASTGEFTSEEEMDRVMARRLTGAA